MYVQLSKSNVFNISKKKGKGSLVIIGKGNNGITDADQEQQISYGFSNASKRWLIKRVPKTWRCE
jgi:hypothetical protein